MITKLEDVEKVFKNSSHMHFIKISIYDMKTSNLFNDASKELEGKNTSIQPDGATVLDKMVAFKDKTKVVYDNVIKFAKQGDFIASLSAKTVTPIQDIYLPIPNVMREVHHQMYEDNSYNLEDRFLRNGAEIAKEIAKSVGGKMGNGAAFVIDATTTAFDQAARRANIAVDPNNLMVYAGSAPRSHSFSFEFIPRNRAEAEYYKNAIAMLKVYSLGIKSSMADAFNKTLSLNVISQQSLFTFGFYTSKANDAKTSAVFEENIHLNTIFACDETVTAGFSLSAITSNLGDNGLVVYNDASPKSIGLSLQFTERKPIFQDDLKNYYTEKLKLYSKTLIPS